jgi:aromatic-L-amino-acid/L-tryptophan decarboxylase
VSDAEGRRFTLDLAEDELAALLAGVTALAAGEVEAARDGAVFAEPPSADRVRALVDGPLPQDGEPLDELLHVCAGVLRAGRRTNPAFFGYVQSPPSPVGIAADLLASAADQNVTAWRSAPAATELERLVVRWLGRFVRYADDAGGILVGGGSAAILTALLVALRVRAPEGADRRALTVHMSSEGHFSIAKAAGALGLTVNRVPADGEQRLEPGALRAAIEADLEAHRTPLAVVASAGTTATGAVDPLEAVADVAAEHRLWFHVDGAYGAAAAADPASRHLFAGMERADSVSLDPHKWLYVPIDCGALLLRDAGATARAFGAGADDYVRVLSDDATEAFAFWDHGLELSRRFRALKVWMTFRYYGAQRIAGAIAEDIAMAEHLAELVADDPALELVAGPHLSICCFRHVPPGLTAGALDAHNQALLAALQRDGRVYLSNATVGGRVALRACITNFRTTRADIRHAVDVVREIGARLA